MSAAALSLLVAASSACQPSGPTGPATSAAPTGTPTAEIVQLNIEGGPGGLNLPDPRVGLDDLTSYESALTASFDGTQAGQPVKWSQTYLFLNTSEPAARQLSIENTGAAPEFLPDFMAETRGALFQRRGEGECFVSPVAPENSLLRDFEPAAQLPGLWGAEEAGKEAVNGVDATRYTFDQRAVGEQGLNESEGEVWLASEGGLVLRYRRTTTGDAAYFGNDTQGTLSWEYTLDGIDQPLTIALPEDCPPGLVDAPSMADAANVKNLPGQLRYETAASLAEVRAFYEQELPKLGWQLAMASNIPPGMTAEQFAQAQELLKGLGPPLPPTPTEDPNRVFEVFHQGDLSMSVLITADGPKTTVLLLLRKAGETK